MDANLCERCSVIRFNDNDIAEFYDAEQEDLPPSLSINRCGKGHRIPLEYEVFDFVPTLPILEESASRGCEFCSILRHEIIRANFNYRGFAKICLAYHWGNNAFEGLGLSALVAEVIPPSKSVRNSLIFAVESDDPEVASWLRIPSLRKDNVLCEENIRFMTQAINQCESECQHSRSSGFLPTRLLDLGPDPSSDSVRLIITSESLAPSGPETKPPRYAALSYCWGSENDAKSQPCTTSDSIEIRKTGIPKDAMSAVLWDAVTVCRSLGIRYLWIDALCILQDDSKVDWESESSLMSLIYSEAFVTICTVSSTSCRESFVKRDRRHVVINFQSRLEEISGSYSLVASGTCRDRVLIGWPGLDVDHTTWSRRGWTLQEELMSRRRLFFGESMLHFECSKQKASENGCKSQPEEQLSLKPEENGERKHSPTAHYEAWDCLILGSYGEREYTKESDRLPGISGLAKYFSEKYGDIYLAGLWKYDLPYTLLWFLYTNHNPKLAIDIPGLAERLCDPLHYLAPSWSPVRRDGTYIEPGIRISKRLLERDGVTNECEIVKVETKPIGQNPWGRIQSGFIRIRGHLKPVPSDIRLCPGDRFPPARFIVQDQGKVVAFGNLDCQPRYPQLADNLRMLLLVSTKRGPSLHQGSDADGDPASGEDDIGSDDDDDLRDAWGLLLHPTGGVEEYIRVGIWLSTNRDGGGLKYFQKGENKEVTIV